MARPPAPPGGILAGMEETLVFELPRHGQAVALYAELAPTRLCLVDYEDGTWCVQAAVDPDADDFAFVLRTVEAWVARLGLGGIRFRADGRSYSLVAAGAGEELVRSAAA